MRDEMTITVNRFYAVVLLLTALFCVAGHYYGPLYPNNRLKPHRWAIETCRQRGVENPEQCGIAWKINPKVSTEIAYFDICLEHGELRRAK